MQSQVQQQAPSSYRRPDTPVPSFNCPPYSSTCVSLSTMPAVLLVPLSSSPTWESTKTCSWLPERGKPILFSPGQLYCRVIPGDVCILNSLKNGTHPYSGPNLLTADHLSCPRWRQIPPEVKFKRHLCYLGGIRYYWHVVNSYHGLVNQIS